MPISSLNNLHKHSKLESSGLPMVIHGPLVADISLICNGLITAEVIEAAQFVDSTQPSIGVNVIELNQLDPLPVRDLLAIFAEMKYLLLIESSVEQDLYQSLTSQTKLKIYHRLYVHPNQSQIVAKIVKQVHDSFLIRT